MKIHNVRLGLATNSSSTHYIVFVKEGEKYYDSYCGQQFGWDDFILASDEAKLEYLGQHLFHNILSLVGSDIARLVAENWTGVRIDTSGYIDHQSFFGLPCDYHRDPEVFSHKRFISKSFFNDLTKSLLKPNIVISGGNDNTELPPIVESNNNKPWYGNDDRFSEALVCRKDPETGVWFLFNKLNGTRITLALNNEENVLPTIPLLIDLKITDCCPYACSYCYQDSRKNGKHADVNVITKIIKALGILEVFEVAIGGGDPTEHPGFNGILQEARYCGIVPNFSTRNKDYIINYLKNKEETDYGAVALSVDSNLKSFAQTLIEEKLLNKFRKSGVIQHVMGTIDKYSLTSLFETVSFYSLPLILLGYKDVGRGKNCKPLDYSNWIDQLKQTKYYKVGIDTLLASQFKKELELNDVSEKTYSTEETDSSLYIDAVEGFIGKSSYCEKEEMIAIDFNALDAEEIAALIAIAFRKFRENKGEIKNRDLKHRSLLCY